MLFFTNVPPMVSVPRAELMGAPELGLLEFDFRSQELVPAEGAPATVGLPLATAHPTWLPLVDSFLDHGAVLDLHPLSPQDPPSEPSGETMDETTFESHKFQGLPVEETLPQDMRKAWGERFGVGPAGFFATFTHGTRAILGDGEIVVERCAGGIDSVEIVTSLLCPESGVVIGRMEREFHFYQDEDPSVNHSFFRLDDSAQDLVPKLLANAIELYDYVGIRMVNMQFGPNAACANWVRYGFRPDSEEDTFELFTTLESRLSELDLPPRAQMVVAGLLMDRDPEALWAISDLHGPQVLARGALVRLGEALLDGVEWDGVLDLDEPNARARFERSIGP